MLAARCVGFGVKQLPLEICFRLEIDTLVMDRRGVLRLLWSTFFNSDSCFLAKWFQLHALSSRKNGGVMRAPKEVLHKLQFFVELLYGLLHKLHRGAAPQKTGICGVPL